MLLHVVHETTYDYSPPVKTAQHVAHLRPAERDGQRVLYHTLGIHPAPARCTESVDVFGRPASIGFYNTFTA
ncbi:MAG: transglutaminase family protein, partial [Comamonadaceae bacterium]